MNIFLLNKNPIIAAKMQCDKHIVKMPLESAQMLCNVWHRFGHDNIPYKEVHKKHPCTLWAGDSASHYEWLHIHAQELCKEYTRRYGRKHKSEDVIKLIPTHPKGYGYNRFKDLLELEHPQCMPDDYKNKFNPTLAYQTYYYFDKYLKGIAKWNKLDNKPEFIGELQKYYRL